MKYRPLVLVIAGLLSLYGCSDGVSSGSHGNGTVDDEHGGTKPGNGSSDPALAGFSEDDVSGKNCPRVDLKTDNNNCGACGHECLNGSCDNGKCICDDGFLDCDGDGLCESYGICVCSAGEEQFCYTGGHGLNVGACKGGIQKCVVTFGAGADWGECEGEVRPSYLSYVCQEGSDTDLDCDGTPDWKQDSDLDGYPFCGPKGKIDCCDNEDCGNTGATMPGKVNPGKQMDCRGNNVDDDCDGEVDEDDISCGPGSGGGTCNYAPEVIGCSEASDYKGFGYNTQSEDAYVLSKAIDMCHIPTVTAESGKSGIIEAKLGKNLSDLHVNGFQVNVLSGMKNVNGDLRISPRAGHTMILLSSGIAADSQKLYELSETNKMSPLDLAFSKGGTIPSTYQKKHGGKLQTHRNCVYNGNEINDSVVFHLKMRAPLDAKGFSFDFRFFTREYPYFICSEYNDFFMAILTDENGNPLADINNDGNVMDEDGNISFDELGNPISVNNAFFTSCVEPPCDGQFKHSDPVSHCPAIMSCSGNRCGSCPNGIADLDAYYPTPYDGAKYTNVVTDVPVRRGGGTAWLTTTAPVKPGEIFNLDFYIWDTGDNAYDSTVIIDNFHWLCDETPVGTDFAPPVDN